MIRRALRLTVLAPLALALVLALALGAAAQSGGFEPGDLYLYNPAFQGISSSSGAIARVEPDTGVVAVVVDLLTSNGSDAMAYDPWRERLIFGGGLTANHKELYLADAAGNVQSLGFATTSSPPLHLFAPRGDGIVYFRGHHAPNQISYLDAADQDHALLNASGAAPYAFPAPLGNVRQLEFHPGTNALVAAVAAGTAVCPGGLSDAVNLHVLQLSPDGSRVVSTSCLQYDLEPGTSAEAPVGLALGPEGDLILHVDDNSTGSLPRIARLDPAAGVATAYATTKYGATSAGCTSQLLARAVMLDSGGDVLRAFAEGGGDVGTVIAFGVSSAGSSGEVATLVEIGPAALHGLSANPVGLSALVGGSQAWEIDLGTAHAGELHAVAGSLTGWTPATPFGGVPVPLAVDAYTVWTLSNQSSSILSGSLGVLDAQGRGGAAFVLPPASAPSLIGTKAYHAAFALSLTGAVTAVTNPVPLEIGP